MLRQHWMFAVLLWVALLQGCASTQSVPELPAELGEKGLLVARLYVPGSTIWRNAQINIDGKLHGANLRDGYVAIALDPGEHKFVQLRLQGQHLAHYEPQESPLRMVRGGGSAPTYYYVPGGTTTIYYTTLSVNRSFTIESGKIANLGLMVYLSADDPSKQRAAVNESKEYYAIPVDNSAEISYYLQTNYPALIATLKDRAPKLAPGKYLEAAKLPELRRFIAAEEVRKGKLIDNGGVSAVYGDAGTVVLSKLGTDGKRTIDVLDTGTLANIVDGQRDDDRFIFLTADAKLLTIDHGRLTQASLPYRIHPVRLGRYGNGNFAIVDNRMTVLVSPNHGKTWSKYDGAAVETPRDDIGLVSDGENAYVYLGNTGVPSAILQFRPGEATPRAIDRPQHDAGISTTSRNTVVARAAGLFIVYNEPRDFYFRPRANERWEVYSKPGTKCKAIGVDDTGRDLRVECDGAPYESHDSGRTWTRTGSA